MGIIERARAAWGMLTSTNWNWRTGTRPGVMFDGSKFRGSMIYPSVVTQDTAVLRMRSRQAYWDSTHAQALIGRLVDNVIGTGLALESRPLWDLIGDQGLDPEALHRFARDIEIRFDLWASSHEPDASGRFNLYQLQAMELLNRLRDGETFHVLRYSGDTSRMSPLNVQTLLTEQVMTPADKVFVEAMKLSGKRIADGVEVDEFNRELAIYVADPTTDQNGTSPTRIPVYGPSGRRFVLHPVNADTLGAIRGTPMLANCIHELQKITDYTVAELEAAIINAVLAVWIEPSADAPASRALSGIQRRGAAESSASRDEGGMKQTTFDKPGLIVQTLKAGEKVQSFDTKRPNVNFGEFVRHIAKNISSAKGVPLEVQEMLFSSNYSASRASLLMFWKKVEIERAATVSMFLAPIYEAWFAEEVKAGRIKAPNFDSSPVLRRAWLYSAWNGDKQPSIDPLKEAMADSERINQGSTTRERVAMEYNGSDAMENIHRLMVENDELAEAFAPLNAAAPPAPDDPGLVDGAEQDDGDGTDPENPTEDMDE